MCRASKTRKLSNTNGLRVLENIILFIRLKIFGYIAKIPGPSKKPGNAKYDSFSGAETSQKSISCALLPSLNVLKPLFQPPFLLNLRLLPFSSIT